VRWFKVNQNVSPVSIINNEEPSLGVVREFKAVNPVSILNDQGSEKAS
jgi:hypothetical protein